MSSARAAGSALGKVSVYSRTSICGPIGRGAIQQIEQMWQGVRADHDVHPRCPPLDEALVLLRQATGHHDPQVGVARP